MSIGTMNATFDYDIVKFLNENKMINITNSNTLELASLFNIFLISHIDKMNNTILNYERLKMVYETLVECKGESPETIGLLEDIEEQASLINNRLEILKDITLTIKELGTVESDTDRDEIFNKLMSGLDKLIELDK